MDVRYWKASFLGKQAAAPGQKGMAAPAPAAAALTPAATAPVFSVAPVASTMLKGSTEVVIEVWRFDKVPSDKQWQGAFGATPWYVVLISLPQDRAGTLTCAMGFGSDARACDQLRDMGLPILDARIDTSKLRKRGKITIEVPSFLDGEAMSFTEQLIILKGVDLSGRATGSRGGKLAKALAAAHGIANSNVTPQNTRSQAARFAQRLVTPQILRPAEEISTRPLELNGKRKSVRALFPTEGWAVKAEFRVARFPDLQPLLGTLDGRDASCGDLGIPNPRPSTAPIRIGRREDAFVPACFRFDNVEVLGFRIDLGELEGRGDALLEKLLAPLNLHIERPPRYALPDFRYEAATPTIVVELLRYGKMALDTDTGQLTRHDFQSQHELVVRILVGRVDDDTSQARDPAVYVPAIFVDNPWSKVLGREGQGFDKRLAVFRSGCGPLRADGFPFGSTNVARRISVADINDICLAGTVGEDSRESLLKLEIVSPNVRGSGNLDDVDLNLALGESALVGAAWRQHDFSEAEFRRSFAGRVMADKTLGFRSVQISPISDIGGFESSWLIGRFDVERVRVGYPAGVVSLTFNSPPGAPKNWQAFCDALRGPDSEGRVDLPTGDWYRLDMKMRLTIEDSLR